MIRRKRFSPCNITRSAALAGVLLGMVLPGSAQQPAPRPRLDVEHYTINAELDPRTQQLSATAQVRVGVTDGSLSTAAFELNNALTVSRVVDANNRQLSASRSQQDFSVRLSLPEPLAKGNTATYTFTYDGKLTGDEESPVFGIKFAAIKPDHAFLLYPARWFPVNDYTVDRYTADISLTVPTGFRVLAGGTETREDVAGNKVTYRFRVNQPMFAGSVAVVQGQPVQVSSQGVTTTLYVRERQAVAQAYGEELGKVMTTMTGLYGPPLQANLTVVETEANTPNGYSAPGLLFLSPRAMTERVNQRLLANMAARQWWGNLVSTTSRNHLWIVNGFARYSEMLYLEQAEGQGAADTELRDTYIEALTVQDPPLIQAARLEDYSPEFWAATAAKGAAVAQMLRSSIGDDHFKQLLRSFVETNAYKQVNTDMLRQAAEKISQQDLRGFFLQWTESTGAPEFKLEYTVFRTNTGFRIMGKVAQDLDTFRMPVAVRVETEGNPEEKRIEVVGTSSEFVIESFGKPKRVILDPNNKVLRYSNPIRVAVAIRRGEQFAEIGEFPDALKEYQKALDVNRNSSLSHYRVAEVFFLQNNYQSAANEFREALNGDLEPKWVEVWSRINLGKIFDVTSQRDRAVNEYNLALRTKDNTQGAQEEAAKYLKTPYERKARVD